MRSSKSFVDHAGLLPNVVVGELSQRGQRWSLNALKPDSIDYVGDSLPPRGASAAHALVLRDGAADGCVRGR